MNNTETMVPELPSYQPIPNDTSNSVIFGYVSLLACLFTCWCLLIGRKKREADQGVVHFCKIHTDATFPRKATCNSAAYDLFSAVDVALAPGQVCKISTGITVIFPPGHHGKIESRSGLYLNHGIQTLGGVIDEDYAGETFVVLHNAGKLTFNVTKGQRMAQFIPVSTPKVLPMYHSNLKQLDRNTERGEMGFGSSGQY